MPMDREAVRDGILDAVYLIALAGGAGYVLFKYVFTRDILFWLLGFLPVPIREHPFGALLGALLILGLVREVIGKIRAIWGNTKILN